MPFEICAVSCATATPHLVVSRSRLRWLFLIRRIPTGRGWCEGTKGLECLRGRLPDASRCQTGLPIDRSAEPSQKVAESACLNATRRDNGPRGLLLYTKEAEQCVILQSRQCPIELHQIAQPRHLAASLSVSVGKVLSSTPRFAISKE